MLLCIGIRAARPHQPPAENKKPRRLARVLIPGPDSLDSAFRATTRLRLSAGKPRWQWQACRTPWVKWVDETKRQCPADIGRGQAQAVAEAAQEQQLLQERNMLRIGRLSH